MARRTRQTLSQKIAAFSKQVLWERSSSEDDEPTKQRSAPEEKPAARTSLEVAAVNRHADMAAADHIDVAHERLRTSRSSAPPAGSGRQELVESMALASPPQAEKGPQLCMVPDTPASDGGRDTAPERHQSGGAQGASDPPIGAAGLSRRFASNDRHAEGSKRQRVGDVVHHDTMHLQEREQQRMEVQHAASQPPAHEHTSEPLLGSAPELLLDLCLCSANSDPQHVNAGQEERAEAKTLAQQQWLAAGEVAIFPHSFAPHASPADMAGNGPLVDCSKQSSDRETPLVQCAQVVADVSTEGSSASAVAARAAASAAPKVHFSHSSAPLLLADITTTAQ